MTNLELWLGHIVDAYGAKTIAAELMKDQRACENVATFRGVDCGMRQHDCFTCKDDHAAWLAKETESQWRTDEPPCDEMVLVTFMEEDGERFVRMATRDDAGEYWADDLPIRDQAIAWQPAPEPYDGPAVMDMAEDADAMEVLALIGMICAKEMAESFAPTLSKIRRVLEEMTEPWQR